MPTARSSVASALANRLAKCRTAAAKRGHRRPHGERRFEPRHSPALLIDADPQRKPGCQGLCLMRQLGDLLGRLDVARKEDDAARENSRASDRISGVMALPGELPINSCPMSRRIVLGTTTIIEPSRSRSRPKALTNRRDRREHRRAEGADGAGRFARA